MGDAADDAFEVELETCQLYAELLAAGCKPCEKCSGMCIEYDAHGEPNDCSKCGGVGWFDKHGNPCEP